MLGFMRSSRASEWYSFDETEPGFVKTAMTITTTPNPPTHCSKALKNSMLCGRISTSINMVIPVPVKADMLSKTPSRTGMWVANVKTNPPIRLAHSHANADIIIPCLKRIFLLTFSSKNLKQKKPRSIEIKPGRIKLTISNSK